MISVNGLLIWPMLEGRNFVPFEQIFVPFEHVFVPFEQIFLPFEHLLSVMFICFMLVVARLHGKENPFSVDSVIESVYEFKYVPLPSDIWILWKRFYLTHITKLNTNPHILLNIF